MVPLLVNIDVPDLAAGEAFYVAALGLTPGRRFDGTVELLGATSPVYLLEKAGYSAPAPDAAPRDYRRHWTPLHLDVAVDDLDAALGRALAAGATLESDRRGLAWGDIATLADPFGHGLCLIRFSEAGYDAVTIPAENRRPDEGHDRVDAERPPSSRS